MRWASSIHWVKYAVLAAACAGCGGDPDPSDEPGQTGAACGSIDPGRSPIRRLTSVEYGNTIRDIFGIESFEDGTRPGETFPSQEEVLGFNNQADTQSVARSLTEQYMVIAEKVAQAALAKHADKLPSCDPAAKGEETCGAAFIEAVGKRVFRRPVAPDEATSLQELFSAELQARGYDSALAIVLEAMLQSPAFLYRLEIGAPDPVEGDVVPLTSYEMATRLSYLLWQSTPDEALLAEAESNMLDTPEKLADQARRMLEDPRARSAVGNFHDQWLALSRLGGIAKDTEIYPSYSDTLPALFRQETLAFVDNVIFNENGDLKTLLSAPYSMMNAQLADFYGIEGGPSGDSFERVDLPADERAGLLTQAGLLAVNARPQRSSPVLRGQFVLDKILCSAPPPPPDVIPTPPKIEPGGNTKDQFSQHSKDPACAGCHAVMDPVGFAFENYDGIGLWRDAYTDGDAVDATGSMGLSGVATPFNGAVELSHHLAESEEARLCLTRQWFRFGYGRAEEAADTCSMERIHEAFAASGYKIKDLLVALTQTDAFRYRRRIAAEGSAQ